ncbi:MAG: DUF2807 domain-containing protein [Bacteroidetes bacterium]|nr:DUF2807 domain-containing protein [Bacteroidota bacterium]MBU2557910.1 DUF2807 domain-containing protein [Bacteroidota bacterium]
MKIKSFTQCFGISLMLLFLSLVSSQLFAATPASAVEKETREVSGFNELEVSGGFEVILTQGSSESLTLEADEDILGNIKTKVVGKTLEIYVQGRIRNYKTMRIYLTFVELNSIDLSGAVSVTADNNLQFDELDLDISGACDLEFNMEANRLILDLSGASKMNLSGIADQLLADCSGSSKLLLANLKAKTVSFESSGASTAEFWVTESLDVESSGASKVRYKGDPKQVNVENSGASSVRKL